MKRSDIMGDTHHRKALILFFQPSRFLHIMQAHMQSIAVPGTSGKPRPAMLCLGA